MWRVLAICASLLASVGAAGAQSPGVAYDRYVQGDCTGAVAAFEDFDLTPAGAAEEALLGAALCCADASRFEPEMGKMLLSAAVGRIDGETDRWIAAKLQTCEAMQIARSREAIGHRRILLRVSTTFSGKILYQCEERNISPLLTVETPIGAAEHHVTPDPAAGLLTPPAALLAELEASLPPSYRRTVCPPFVAASASQDPGAICEAAARFGEFLAQSYQLQPPPVWTVLVHHRDRDALVRSMKRADLSRCTGALGYFDWQRNRIEFAAPPGLFGTFNHELAHAFLHWGAPLLPRWFEEGIAALYENAEFRGGAYCGIENPWRSERIKRSRWAREGTMDRADDIVRMPVFSFEADPAAASVARELIRGIQDNGNLVGLYRRLRAGEADVLARGAPSESDILARTPDEVAQIWLAAIAESLAEEGEVCR